MGVLDWILLVIRWGHAVAAVAWVGGGIFYLMVLRPALRRNSLSTEANRSVGVEFRGLVNTAIAVLLLTGVMLSVARLTEDSITIPYVAVLVVKIVLALYMFYVVRFLRPATYTEGDRGRDRLVGQGAGRLDERRSGADNRPHRHWPGRRACLPVRGQPSAIRPTQPPTTLSRGVT